MWAIMLVLLFIDNIFRFSQAGSEVSALLGRMPSAVGYQPTLASEMGALEERIVSTRDGSITSVQAVYVPADDLTDPAPAAIFSQMAGHAPIITALSAGGVRHRDSGGDWQELTIPGGIAAVIGNERIVLIESKL